MTSRRWVHSNGTNRGDREASRDSWRLQTLRDGAMPNHGKYPDETGERAVRMVFEHEHEHEYPSQWG